MPRIAWSVKLIIALNSDFEDTIDNCIGKEFAINRGIFSELEIGMAIIILDKRKGKQAQAFISRFELGTVTASHIQRYNIFFSKPRLVAYTGDTIKLNPCGIAVLPFPLNAGASE